MAIIKFKGIAINIDFNDAWHKNFNTDMMDVKKPGIDGNQLLIMGRRKRPINIKGRVIDVNRGDIIDLVDSIPRNVGGTLLIDLVPYNNTRFINGKVTNQALARPNAGPGTGGGEFTAEIDLQFVQLIPDDPND